VQLKVQARNAVHSVPFPQACFAFPHLLFAQLVQLDTVGVEASALAASGTSHAAGAGAAALFGQR
jgi:hypothetical protein